MSTSEFNQARTPKSQWGSVGVWVAFLGLAVLLLISLRALVDPAGMSRDYGVGMRTPTETTFVLVYGTRNAALAAIGLALLLLRRLKPLLLMLIMAAPLPLADAWIVISRGGGTPVRHAASFLVLTLAAALLWRRERTLSG